MPLFAVAAGDRRQRVLSDKKYEMEDKSLWQKKSSRWFTNDEVHEIIVYSNPLKL